MSNETTEITPEQKWKNATIANNFIFYKVMRHNPDVCKELLEILLEFKIDHIEMKQEEEIEIDYGKKGVRLDVYAFGSTKTSKQVISFLFVYQTSLEKAWASIPLRTPALKTLQ